MSKIVLVVDDTKYIREDLREILENQGYEVYEAKDGLEGVEMYKKIKPLFVTMDINMPNLNGIEATKVITEYDKDAKIMICSTMASFKHYINMGKEAGAKAFLPKPYTDEEFINELAKLFL